MKKQDIFIIALLIVIGGALFIFLRTGKADGTQVVVRVDGQEVAAYSLMENRTEVIQGVDGGTNTLIIENGEAYLSEATCPDKLCVKQGAVHKDGESIICLPNKVVVEVSSEETSDAEFDIIAR